MKRKEDLRLSLNSAVSDALKNINGLDYTDFKKDYTDNIFEILRKEDLDGPCAYSFQQR